MSAVVDFQLGADIALLNPRANLGAAGVVRALLFGHSELGSTTADLRFDVATATLRSGIRDSEFGFAPTGGG